MAIAPWATSVEFQWPPNLRYYQQRWEIVADIESLIGLRDFHAAEDAITARLEATGWAEIALRPDGLALHRRLPEGDWSDLLLAARLVVGAIEPRTLPHIQVYTQFLLDLATDDYDLARMQTARNLGGAWVGDIGLTDWSILLDGNRGGFAYQVEAGVVSREEVPGRLSRRVGRVVGPGLDIRGLIAELQPDDVPAVAFFADFSSMPLQADADHELADQCIDLVDQSTVIVSDIFKAVTASAEADESAAL